MDVLLDFILADKYKNLFDTCSVKPTVVRETGKVINSKAEIDGLVNKIIANKAAYMQVVSGTNIPWYFIGVIDAMEGGGNANTHLHNGDSLSKRTVNVPAGRPLANPANGVRYTFVESAKDAIALKKFNTVTNWSVAGMLYLWEKYNGWGYMLYHPAVNSPYLWSFSNHYTKGKYTTDHGYDANVVSAQPGAATILKALSLKLPEVASNIKVANDQYAASVKKKS